MGKNIGDADRVRRAFLGVLWGHTTGESTKNDVGFGGFGISSRIIRPSPTDKPIEVLQDECSMIETAGKQIVEVPDVSVTGSNVSLCHASAFGLRNFMGLSTTRLGRILGVSTRLINYRECNESSVPNDDAIIMAKQENRQMLYISAIVNEARKLHESGLTVPLFIYRKESEMRLLCCEMADMPTSANIAITSCAAAILDAESIPYTISERRFSEKKGGAVDVVSSVYHKGRGSQELRFMRMSMDLSSTAAALMCDTNLRGWQYYEAGSADCKNALEFMVGKYNEFRATVNRMVGEALCLGGDVCTLRIFEREAQMWMEYPALSGMPMSVHHAALRQTHCMLKMKRKTVRYMYAKD